MPSARATSRPGRKPATTARRRAPASQKPDGSMASLPSPGRGAKSRSQEDALESVVGLRQTNMAGWAERRRARAGRCAAAASSRGRHTAVSKVAAAKAPDAGEVTARRTDAGVRENGGAAHGADADADGAGTARRTARHATGVDHRRVLEGVPAGAGVSVGLGAPIGVGARVGPGAPARAGVAAEAVLPPSRCSRPSHAPRRRHHPLPHRSRPWSPSYIRFQHRLRSLSPRPEAAAAEGFACPSDAATSRPGRSPRGIQAPRSRPSET